MSYVSQALLATPCGVPVRGPGVISRVLRKASDCTLCIDRVFVELDEFVEFFAAEVERRISIVSPTARVLPLLMEIIALALSQCHFLAFAHVHDTMVVDLCRHYFLRALIFVSLPYFWFPFTL